MPRCGSDTADRDADPGASAAGECGEYDGADVSGYAGIECEQQRNIGWNGELHEPGGDGGAVWWAYVYGYYFGVRGFFYRAYSEPGADWNADCSNSNSRGQLDEDCDHSICAVRDRHGMVVLGGGHNGSDPVLQLDSASRADRDRV